MASPQYANLTKKPQGWVAPSAVTGAARGTEDAVPVGPAVATAVVSMGKGKASSKAASNRRGQGAGGQGCQLFQGGRLGRQRRSPGVGHPGRPDRSPPARSDAPPHRPRRV